MKGHTNNPTNIKGVQSNLDKLKRIIKERKADACIITSSVNQYWLCGFIFDGYIYITPDSINEPILFVRRPSDLKDNRTIFIRKPEQIPDLLRNAKLPIPKSFLIEADYLTFSAATRLKAALNAN